MPAAAPVFIDRPWTDVHRAGGTLSEPCTRAHFTLPLAAGPYSFVRHARPVTFLPPLSVSVAQPGSLPVNPPTHRSPLSLQFRTVPHAGHPENLKTPSAPQPEDIQMALEVSSERRPALDGDGLSASDAVWPRRLRRIVRASLIYWGRPYLVEAAELLVSELATNALCHAGGLDVGVRMYLQADHLKIEVDDGSPLRPVPRCAAPHDESGRGLFLVACLAEDWGVSEDGTATWCILPLTKGPSGMEPAAVTAPVQRRIPCDIPSDSNAGVLARLQARTLLTVLSWRGDYDLPPEVVHVLVDNAMRHTGKILEVSFSITEAHELIIDVTDPDPTFPEFDKAIAGVLGGSLGEIMKRGVTLCWFVGSEFASKTVRAVVRPGPVNR